MFSRLLKFKDMEELEKIKSKITPKKKKKYQHSSFFFYFQPHFGFLSSSPNPTPPKRHLLSNTVEFLLINGFRLLNKPSS
jgi:hypothetical protein